ncbi:unnamed protein product, partial [Didymodactylos carnosus]
GRPSVGDGSVPPSDADDDYNEDIFDYVNDTQPHRCEKYKSSVPQQHPFYDEIKKFQSDSELLKSVRSQVFIHTEHLIKTPVLLVLSSVFSYPLDDATYLYVDTIDMLKGMMDHLEKQQQFAVDCEVFHVGISDTEWLWFMCYKYV